MTPKQRSLFDDDPAPWQEDDESEHSVAAILFPNGPDRPFDYLVPDRLRDEVDPGRRVRVPFGRGDRLVTGYCIEVQTKPVGPRRLKEVRDVVDPRPLISPSMLRLTQWIAHRY
ncbi:MAG: primosomal protein N', partial [Planctomycetes bacterium]|nr:primosomal protein N' [Planctomycetota bacterium]